MAKIITYSTGSDGAIVMLDDWSTNFVEKAIIADLFEKYGWSFAKAMWVALHRADAINTKKILDTWETMTREYIETFLQFKP